MKRTLCVIGAGILLAGLFVALLEYLDFWTIAESLANAPRGQAALGAQPAVSAGL